MFHMKVQPSLKRRKPDAARQEQNIAREEKRAESRERSILHVFGLAGLFCLLGMLWLESRGWEKVVNQKRLDALIIAILATHAGGIFFRPSAEVRKGLFVLSLILLALLALIEVGNMQWRWD